MRDVIIEVRGGVLVEIYSNDPNMRIVVVNWDRIEEGEEAAAGFEWQHCNLNSMPEDTNAEYAKATSVSRADDCIITRFDNT